MALSPSNNSGSGKTLVALGLGLDVCKRGATAGFSISAALVHEWMDPCNGGRPPNLHDNCIDLTC